MKRDWPPSAANALAKIATIVEDLTRGYFSWNQPPEQLAEKIAFVCIRMRTIHVVVSNSVVNRHSWFVACEKLKHSGIFVVFSSQNIYDISTTCNNKDFKIIVISEGERGILTNPSTPNCAIGIGVTQGNEANWLRQKVLQYLTDWLN